MSPLLPALLPEQLIPANAVYMARTNLFETRMLGYNDLQLDTVTSVLMGVLNGLATVRHVAGASPEVIEIFSRAGIRVEEEVHLYETESEARACANRLLEAGRQFFGPYPLPHGYYPDSAHLVGSDLYHRLNSKQNLAQLVSREHLAAQKVLTHEMLDSYQFSGSICLKAAGNAATGWGYAVFPCPDEDALAAAKAWFHERKEDIPAVLVEEWVDVDRSWCVGLAVSETQTVCFGGAEQVFSMPGKQSGSIVDSDSCLPAEVESLAVQAGEAGRRLGFRGLAGLDIGCTTDGRFILFDPNFRCAACTAQLLFHPAAAARSGLPVSRSFQVNASGKFDAVTQKLHGPIDEGWFVPTRLFNGERHPLCDGKHLVTGFVMGMDRDAALQAWNKLQGILLNG